MAYNNILYIFIIVDYRGLTYACKKIVSDVEKRGPPVFLAVLIWQSNSEVPHGAVARENNQSRHVPYNYSIWCGYSVYKCNILFMC